MWRGNTATKMDFSLKRDGKQSQRSQGTVEIKVNIRVLEQVCIFNSYGWIARWTVGKPKKGCTE